MRKSRERALPRNLLRRLHQSRPSPARSTAHIPVRQHPLMEHPDDGDDPSALRAIEDHMDGVTDRRLTTVAAAVADVIAAQAGEQIAAIDARR